MAKISYSNLNKPHSVKIHPKEPLFGIENSKFSLMLSKNSKVKNIEFLFSIKQKRGLILYKFNFKN